MWKDIIGQEEVKEKLKTIYSSDKVSHAYLFHGIDGAGKDAAAIEFAKVLNCTNYSEGGACGKCSNCKNISVFRPDYFHFICALPTGKSEQTGSSPLDFLTTADYESYLEQIKLKIQNPYHQINISGANNIRINSIRDLVNKIYLSAPAQGGMFMKVFLISEAEKMKQEASNALLKVLEEPPKNSVIIMTSSKPYLLPQTIAGRCQMIHFTPLSPEQIEEQLKHEPGAEMYSEQEIKLACKFSQGSYSRAFEILGYKIKQVRETVLKFLISIIKNDYAETVSVCKDIGAKTNKDKAKYFLFCLSVWFKDLMHVKYNSSGSIVNSDIKERLTKFLQNYNEVDFFKIITSIEEAEKMTLQNIQMQLILIDLSFKLKKYLKK